MKTDKGFVLSTITIVMVMLAALGGFTIAVDPFFHYHVPLGNLQYSIDNERYQNDGIVKHFQYDAIITGSSMTDNFKTSEADELFNANFIKIPFSGTFYKEVSETLKRAIMANPDIHMIIWGLDASHMAVDKDRYAYDTYPDYLYDNNLFNDVYYFWNKDVLLNCSLETLSYTNNGGKTTTFDEYSNWNSYSHFGKEAIDSIYQRKEKSETMQEWKSGDEEAVKKNIEQNVIALAEANPDITFYLFIPPYSIYNWDSWSRSGTLQYQLSAQKCVIEMLVQYDNIKLYSFYDNFDLVCDLSHYKDLVHYSEDVNSQMLHWMKQDRYRLTKDNYEDYCQKVEEFYTSYNYDSLFE